MALPINCYFDGGTVDTDVTSTNTPEITSQTGTKAILRSPIPPDDVDDTFCAEVNQSANGQNNIDFGGTETTAWIGFYFYKVANPGSNTYMSAWLNNVPTKIGDLRLNSDGSMSLRDNNTEVWQSGSVATGTWHRAALKVVPNSSTGHRLKLYLGSNRHGSTPDQDSGDVAATAAGLTNIQIWRFGLISGTSLNYRIARIKIATTEPAAITSTSFDWFVASSGSWVGETVKVAKAGSWV